MKHLQEWPIPLLRKWLLSCAIGPGCLLIGIIMYIAADDRILLTISILLALLTIARCVLLYRQIGGEAYEIIEGVCIKIKKAPLRKQRSLSVCQKSQICAYQRTRVAEDSGPYRIVFGRNLCDYGQKHHNPPTFSEEKAAKPRRSAEPNCRKEPSGTQWRGSLTVSKAPLRKQRSLCLLTDAGAEHTVTLEQQIPIRIGNRYRLFYLPSGSMSVTGLTLDGHQFLALEDLGEFSANCEESENKPE